MAAFGVIPPIQAAWSRSVDGSPGGCSHTVKLQTDDRDQRQRASDQGQPGGHAQWGCRSKSVPVFK